jgi:arylsulfatase A-like enzyme
MVSSSERMNILLVLTDQHRYDTLGCYDAPTCRTPNIDSLAERGVRFGATYTPASPCSPARAALFTGLYPHRNHVDVMVTTRVSRIRKCTPSSREQWKRRSSVW